MKRSNQATTSVAPSGEAVYAEISKLAQKLSSDMLARMIDSAGGYRGWELSDWDQSCLIKLLHEKKSLICATFSVQLQRNFDDFKHSSKEQEARDWRNRGSRSTRPSSIPAAWTRRISSGFEPAR